LNFEFDIDFFRRTLKESLIICLLSKKEKN